MFMVFMSVSGMVGRGCHEVLKVYYGGGPDDVNLSLLIG